MDDPHKPLNRIRVNTLGLGELVLRRLELIIREAHLLLDDSHLIRLTRIVHDGALETGPDGVGYGVGVLGSNLDGVERGDQEEVGVGLHHLAGELGEAHPSVGVQELVEPCLDLSGEEAPLVDVQDPTVFEGFDDGSVEPFGAAVGHYLLAAEELLDGHEVGVGWYVVVGQLGFLGEFFDCVGFPCARGAYEHGVDGVSAHGDSDSVLLELFP